MPHVLGKLALLVALLECILLVEASQDGGSELKVLRLVAMVADRSNGTRTTQDWERGLEILPGARVAVGEVNRNTVILPGYQLELVELITEGCSGNLALVQLIQHLTTQAKSEEWTESLTVGIIGSLCNEAAELVASVAGHPGITLVQITASPSTLFDDRRGEHPYLFQMLPLSQAYINTVLGLMSEFGWDKLAILCSLEQDLHGCQTANTFESEALKQGVDILYSSKVGAISSSHQSTTVLLKDLRESGAKIIVAFLPPLLASKLSCAAYREGLSWPEYAWILPGLEAQHFVSSSLCDDNTIALASEGLLLLEYEYAKLSFQSTSGLNSSAHYYDNTTSSKQMDLHGNLYASVFYDCVWAFALALNQSNLQVQESKFPFQGNDTATSISTALLNVSFSGSTGQIEFDGKRDRKYVAIQVNHIREQTSISIAHYSQFSSSLNINVGAIGEVPDDELETVYYSDPLVLTIILAIFTIICFVLTTLMFLLFIYYRNEPEVKATSTPLSMFLFLGCYLQLVGTTTWIISGAVAIHSSAGRVAICQIQYCFSTTGLVLILAPLLVRMLRVYRVFTYFGRTGKLCSNGVLASLIIGLALVNVLILSLWAATDHIRLIDETTYHPEGRPPYYEAIQYCYSELYDMWVGVIVVYIMILLIAILILAFLTRKIRWVNFKDTKKVNSLLGLYVIVGILLATLYFLYFESNPSVAQGLSVGLDTVIVYSCQLSLFLPKTAPTLWRNLRKTQHNHGTIVSTKFSII